MTKRFARPGGANGSSGILTPANLVGGAANGLGNWVDIAASGSVVRDVCGLSFCLVADVGSNGANTQMLLDIGLGNTGNAVDKTILENYPVGGRINGGGAHIPLHVPAGVRIAGRIRAFISADIFDATWILHYGSGIPGFQGFTSGLGLNVDTANTGFNHGDLTDNAYDQVIASTDDPYRAVSFVGMCFTSASTTAQIDVDVGLGAGGSEQVIGTYMCRTLATEQIGPTFGPDWIDKPIAAGSRLALRKNDTANLTGTIIAWR